MHVVTLVNLSLAQTLTNIASTTSLCAKPGIMHYRVLGVKYQIRCIEEQHMVGPGGKDTPFHQQNTSFRAY